MKTVGILSLLLTLFPSNSAFASGQQIHEAVERGLGVEVRILAPRYVARTDESFPIQVHLHNPQNERSIAVRRMELRYAGRILDLPVESLLRPTGLSLRTLKEAENQYHLNPEGETEASSRIQQYKKLKHDTFFAFEGDMAAVLEAEGRLELEIRVYGGREGGEALLGIASTEILHRPGKLKLFPGIRPELPDTAVQNLASTAGYYRGDTHVHSYLSAEECWYDGTMSMEQLQSTAKAVGLHWLALTDHNYSVPIATWYQWKNRLATEASFNSGSFTILMGQEISAREDYSSNGWPYDTCHINGIGHSTFISGDYQYCTKKAYAPGAKEAINKVKSYGGFAIINHPCAGNNSSDAWDFNLASYAATKGEDAMEVINMEYGGAVDEGQGSSSNWIRQRLLKGHKVLPVAGSDTENNMHLGQCSTVVHASGSDRPSLLAGLKKGRLFATTGPWLVMDAQDYLSKTWYSMGEKKANINGGKDGWAWVSAWVDHERNDDLDLRFLVGRSGWSYEQLAGKVKVLRSEGNTAKGCWVWLPAGSYVRTEVISTTDPAWKAYSAPIWRN